MLTKLLILTAGIVIGVTGCVLFQFVSNSGKTVGENHVAKVSDGEQFSVVCKPYVVITGQVKNCLEVVLMENGKERGSVSAESGVLKYYPTTYDQGRRTSLIDMDGDGMPDVKTIYDGDGSLLSTQLFYKGAFTEAKPTKDGWMIGDLYVVFKDHRWTQQDSNQDTPSHAP